MAKLLLRSGLLLVIAIGPVLLYVARADEKPAKPLSAKEIGKQWRFPGLGNDGDVKPSDANAVWEFFGPLDDKFNNLDRSSMQFARPKVEFDKVWNFYASKCGFDKKWEPNKYVLAIDKTEGNGQRMLLDQPPGLRLNLGTKETTDFGLFTDEYSVHVQIRKVDDEHTAIQILTTIR